MSNNAHRPIVTALLAWLGLSLAHSDAARFPSATSEAFCIALQHFLADTRLPAQNTLFTEMPAYRASKPSVNPLTIYQIVTYQGALPVAVSCKVKTADHLRAAYGNQSAGIQRYCPAATAQLQRQAVTELQTENRPEAAAVASRFIVEDNAPFMTGQSYLQSFELSFRSDSGGIHLNSPGLQTNWDNWLLWIMPDYLRGQTYCHLPTVDYLKALATGVIEPGTLITTADDAPNSPRQ